QLRAHYLAEPPARRAGSALAQLPNPDKGSLSHRSSYRREAPPVGVSYSSVCLNEAIDDLPTLGRHVAGHRTSASCIRIWTTRRPVRYRAFRSVDLAASYQV